MDLKRKATKQEAPFVVGDRVVPNIEGQRTKNNRIIVERLASVMEGAPARVVSIGSVQFEVGGKMSPTTWFVTVRLPSGRNHDALASDFKRA